ncbi:HAD family hydrolase [soil metagenome]
MDATVSDEQRAPAVLFDVDGTLVDSNYLHVHAWAKAFAEVGKPVESWRIHRSIGMDGAELVASLSGGADDDVTTKLKDLHSQFYEETTSLLRPLPGARELLDRVAALGLQVVLATSAPEDELSTLRKVLDRDDVVSTATSSGDVSTAKPQPDIVEIALERAGVAADRAVFVGDAVWDAEASGRAGVQSIGVLSGGFSRGELEEAGASAVFENAHELCEQIEDSPIGRLLSVRRRAERGE